jgi:dolichol-phosphate mannosyltransferase
VTDPMSGFFLIRRGHVDAGVLRPDGFKILLEVLVRHAGTLREVPFAFGTRHAGDSKASYREGLRFLRHLLRLRLGDRGTRMAGFAAVGASGVAVNTAALAALLSLGGAHVLVWSFVATQVAIVWNFSLSERWVFRGQQVGLWSRLSSYTALNNASFALSGPLLMALITIAALPVLLANVVSLGVLAIVRFVISDRLIWRATSSAPQPPARVAVLLPVTRTRDDACVAA